MRTNRLMTAAVLGGALGLVASPVWSQNQPMDSHPSQHITKEPSGTPPGAMPKGDLGMSHDEIRAVQQALEEKGFNAGTSGVLDHKTQDALRAFQKNNNLPITGSIDNKTAEKLGVQLDDKSAKMESNSGKKSNMR